MHSITANELKIKGAALLEQAFSEENELTITVHGAARYVVMPVEQYERYRETEILAALAEAQADIAAGRVFNENIEEHIKRISR